jgi:hypothetical protein
MVAVVIVLTLGLIGGAFYWFAYRPTEIRKNCAKVSVTISAVQEVTKEEADLSKANNEECKSKIDVDGAINQWYEEEKCNQQYPIKEQTQYQPERQSVRDAKDSEYQKCLRENGLQ